ncbi:MAG: flagellar biosynthetic protein FliO [Treponema sp.]|nr:flagellar biosynthetic protein FliO [Treponema sp.]
MILLITGRGASALWAQETDVPPDAAATNGANITADPGADEQNIRLGEEASGGSVAVPGPVSGFAIFRAVLLLILAAGAIYGVVYAVKKLSRPRDARSPHLRVLASTQLGPNRFVHVVALGTRGWLIGSGEGGISHIADIEEQEALDALFLEESRNAAFGPSGRPGDFRSLLRRLGIGSPGPEAAGPAGGTTGLDDGETLAGNIRRRRDRLRGL